MKILLFCLCLGVALQARAGLPAGSFEDILTGNKVELPFKKKTVVLFFNHKCPCTKNHHQHLKELVKDNPEVGFLGIHVGTKEHEKVTDYYRKIGFSFPMLQDHKHLFADALAAVKTPHSYLLDESGEIIYQGGITNSRDPKRAKSLYLRDVLADVKAGRPPRYKETRILGCYIAR